MPFRRLALAVTLVTFSALAFAQQESPQRLKAQQPRLEAAPAQAAPQAAQERHQKLKATVATLDELIRRKPNADLTAEQRTEWKEQTKWLKSVRDRYKKMSSAYSPARLRSSATDMAKLDAEFLALQNAIQMESRKYQTISNALKVRHDVAMKSIQNTRA